MSESIEGPYTVEFDGYYSILGPTRTGPKFRGMKDFADEKCKEFNDCYKFAFAQGQASKEARIKELEEKLKEAVKVFETCSNAMSRQVSIRDENRLGWAFKEVVEFLEKLKAE